MKEINHNDNPLRVIKTESGGKQEGFYDFVGKVLGRSTSLGKELSDCINQDGDDKTDGEVIDEIVAILIKYNLYEPRK